MYRDAVVGRTTGSAHQCSPNGMKSRWLLRQNRAASGG
jgi:hypothetical protein